ncbi:hypothetical protein Zmor_011522 [Zophobas morio]|uniref:Secreted protein n=1 Tax=Zophobas morio TaxID=2755281 RepID=A0AA38MKW2_9CUCU|nr:hypothetical protein Zmor_011522 [Zophobas morio]
MKTILLFLLGNLLVFQALASDITPFSAWHDAEAIQDQYHNYTNEFLFRALGNFYANMSRWTDLTAESTIAGTTEEIGSKFKLMVEEYQSLKNRKEISTAGTQKCADIYENQIINLEAAILDDLFECVKNRSDEAIDFIKTASLKLVENYFTLLFNYETQLIACDPSDDECLNTFFSGVRGVIENLGTSINSDALLDSKNFEYSYLVAIAACGQQELKSIEENGKQLIDHYQKCTSDILKF